jgi:hypothetical protein
MRRLLLGTALLLAAATGAGAAPSKPSTLLHFQSPSGNIDCYLGSTPSDFAECLVEHATWPSPKPKPARCDLDWAPYTASTDGRHVSVGDCRGDIGPLCMNQSGERCTTLAYGHALTLGRLRCVSSPAGIACRSRFGRHRGFLISREKVVTYG